MADAIRSGACAGVGLGRPAGSDPLLPAEIVQGKVSGATENKLPPHDFGQQLLATGIQMEAIARGKPVFDLSDPKALSRFAETAQAYHKKQAESVVNGTYNPRFPTIEV